MHPPTTEESLPILHRIMVRRAEAGEEEQVEEWLKDFRNYAGTWGLDEPAYRAFCEGVRRGRYRG
jgi:hypothetical protein